MTKTNIHREVIAVSKSYHDTVALYGRSFFRFMGIAFIPTALTFVLINAFTLFALTTYASGRMAYFIATMLVIVTIILIQVWAFIALIYISLHHETSTVAESFHHALHFFWRFVKLGLAVSGIFFLSFLAGYIVVGIIGIILGHFSLSVLNSTFDWLTLIPLGVSAVVSTYYLFAPFSIIDTHAGTIAALKHSRHLVRGHFWPTAIRVVLLYVVVGMFTYAFQYVPAVGSILSLLLVSPFSVIYLSVLYRELTVSKPLS
ncbi:MAG: hypothetical protein HYV32_03155 [Candidatus Kerfeldbacteria bacterium]|nr:hypothetical protein [Candidatus Kerfeldbacteria bacterium]